MPLSPSADSAVIGFVHALPHATTWSAKGYLYLEDLFVDPAMRGSGAGRKLIEAVYEEADRLGRDRGLLAHRNEQQNRPDPVRQTCNLERLRSVPALVILPGVRDGEKAQI